MKSSEILVNAKSLIDTPEKWTKGQFARDKYGVRTSVYSDNAVCFCAAGALRVATKDNAHSIDRLWDLLNASGKFMSIVETNDTGTHDDVMAMFDVAIGKLVEQEKEHDAS